MFKFFKQEKTNSFDPSKIKLDGWQPDPANKQYLRFDKASFQVDNTKTARVQYQSSDEIDLRPYSSPRHDQRSTSSCVAQSTIKALEIKRIIQHGHSAHVDLSILDLYYGARERMTPSMVGWDSGTHISLACDVLRDLGVCSDKAFSWDNHDVYAKPPVMASREARLNRIKSHFKIKSYGQDRLDDIIFNLKAHNPVVFGTQVGTDWMKYRGGKEPLHVERTVKGRHAMCCLPGTTINTENGIDEIQNIELGRLILTREGLFPVTATTESMVNEYVYEIDSQLSVEPLVVTCEHPILIKQAGKWDRFSRIDMSKFEFINASDVKKGWYVKTVIDDSICDYNISEDFARLLGYYIGDGNLQIRKNKDGTKIKSINFRLTYNRDDKKEIVDDLIKIIEMEYPGTNHSIFKDKNSKTNIISFYNTNLSRRILAICGGLKEKDITKLHYINPKLQLQIIKGWYKTDGCGRWLDKSKIFTANKNLADSLVFMLQRCRLTYCIDRRKPYKNIIHGKSYQCTGGYYVSFHTPKPKDRMYYNENEIFTRITSVSKKWYKGIVYNLEVDTCHEYVANNIITHNCIVGFVGGLFIVENSWGCYDDQTEVLTESGWKNWTEVNEQDVFATLNPETHVLEYQKASKLHEYDFDGELNIFNSQGVDLAVTPNHRMYVTNYRNKNNTSWDIKQAAEINGRVCFKKDAINKEKDIDHFIIDGNEVIADSWIEFMGYFISEGSTTYVDSIRTRERSRDYKVIGGTVRCGTTGKFIDNETPQEKIKTSTYIETYREKYHTTSISQTVGDNSISISKCLGSLPFTFSSSIREKENRKPITYWTNTSKSIYEYLEKLGKAHEKYIPREFLKLSKRQSEILLNALMLGDGTTSAGKFVYYTSSKQLADDVQELALRCGFAADISITDRTDQSGYNHQEYVVGIKRTRTKPESKHIQKTERYSGKVYCATVPNGLLYVRRNGQAVWCGNSDWGDDGFGFVDPAVFTHASTQDLWVIVDGSEAWTEKK